MKCPICSGYKELDELFTGAPIPCNMCDGRGKIRFFEFLKFVVVFMILLGNYDLYMLQKELNKWHAQ